jgi:hypothetical protein
MQTLRVTVLALLALASRATAQQQTGEVNGTVYDSVAKAPLRGAIVQMVATAGTPLFTDSTDARGRFAFKDVPPGRYFVEFTHPVLDSLALVPPLSGAEVRAGETTRLALGVPSPATVLTQICKATPADSAGLFFGVLRDARTGRGLDSGQVKVRWHEIVIDTSGFNSSEKGASATSSGGGWFAMCGVPQGTDVIVQAVHGTDSTGMALVSVPAHGLMRFDLDVGGEATIHGRITSRGRPLPNARVRAGGESRMAYTDSAGAYRLRVPAGTQTVDFRAIGYAPQATVVTLAAESSTEMSQELTTFKRVLDTIQVLAKRVYSIDAKGFERRRKSAAGMFFDADMVRRRSPYSVMQLLYDVPSLRVYQSGLDRTIVMRGGNSFSSQPCAPAFFLDGVEIPSEFLTDLDMYVRPQTLEGMEVYRGMMVPPEFHRLNKCGAIVVWTRRSPLPRR